MDEATSSIDMNTDEVVREVMMQVFKDKTVIIIGHRLSSIVICDRLFEIKEEKMIAGV